MQSPPDAVNAGLGIVLQVTSHAATTATHKFANRVWTRRRHHLQVDADTSVTTSDQIGQDVADRFSGELPEVRRFT
jgi:hypothetical protein